ncbi:MAG: flavin-containing monooxygenase [Janthinobacterium lividum]
MNSRPVTSTTSPAAASRTVQDVVVIGAGTAGLAAAAELGRHGMTPLLLDRGSRVGQVWRSRYARLHLHTVRRHSALPRLRVPRRYGRFVAAADFADYLELYAAKHGLAVRFHTGVHRISPVAGSATETGARWLIETSAGALGESGGMVEARTVVVATGRLSKPVTPDWPHLAEFEGRFLLGGDYRRGDDFAGRRVLVVGAGNSGGEIAVDLAESGARSVDLAVRTPPHIVRREMGRFWSSQQSGILFGRLPTPLLDLVGRIQVGLSVPDLTPYGLPRPQVGIATRLRRDGVVPLQDVGLIDAVRSGTVRVRPAVSDLTATGARFVDSTTAQYDAIVAAVGYRPALASTLTRELLDARGLPRVSGGPAAAPGLYFTGYTLSISGTVRDAGIEARRVVRTITHEPPVELTKG